MFFFKQKAEYEWRISDWSSEVCSADLRAGRERRMARRFPQADVVVFGHSHDPVVMQVPDGPLLVNPGSPTQKRRQPVPTVAWLVLSSVPEVGRASCK